MRRRLVLLAGGAWMSAPNGAASAPAPALPIRYPAPLPSDGMARYVLDLFAQALGEQPARFELVPAEQNGMAQVRNLRELGEGVGEMGLVWTMSNAERESLVEPIRIPLDRGLFGWRLSLIRRDDVPSWQAMTEEATLRRLVAGQGHDWPDAQVLRANGIPVVTGYRYDGLFEMLARKRFDHFPRSVLEIGRELQSQPELAIAPGWMIQYPTALYAFVSRREPEFARLLSAALEGAVRGGLAQRLFHQHFDGLLRGLALHGRRVLRLSNPLMHPATPLQRAELWERP